MVSPTKGHPTAPKGSRSRSGFLYNLVPYKTMAENTITAIPNKHHVQVLPLLSILVEFFFFVYLSPVERRMLTDHETTVFGLNTIVVIMPITASFLFFLIRVGL